MTVHGIGACMLLSLMRLERRAELDSSWLIFGPVGEEEAASAPEEALAPAWRYAAE
jgi:hypothetical protein